MQPNTKEKVISVIPIPVVDADKDVQDRRWNVIYDSGRINVISYKNALQLITNQANAVNASNLLIAQMMDAKSKMEEVEPSLTQ